MCGIALILSGVRLIGEALFQESCRARPSDSDEVYEPVLSVDELKVSLQRRGPDNLGSRRIFLQRKPTISVEDHADNNEEVCRVLGYHEKNHLISAHETVGAQNGGAVGVTPIVDLRFLGAMLQLRGKTPVSQPLVDASGNLLVYNGEIFGGIHVAGDSNDAEILLHALERCYACECYGPQKCCSCQKKGEKSIPEVLSTIKGPWAVIYWQERSKTIWFGRDAFGRRSLLVHWPTRYDSQFILSSVSPLSSVRKDSGNESIKHLISSCIPGPVSQDKCLEDEADSDVADTGCNLKNWEELPCGIYSICLKRSKPSAHSQDENFYGEVEKHEWTDAWLSELIKWERSLLDPKAEKVSSYNIPFMSDKYARPLCSSEGMLHNVGDIGAQMEKQPHSTADITSSSNIIHAQAGYAQPACKVLTALREAVMCRTVLSTIYQTSQKGDGEKDPAPVAVLFSGGLDSMILAALLDQCLDSRYTIDLLNVSFDGQHAPDRISAKAGVRELGRIAHTRRWRLVEIDANLSDLNWETRHVVSLIHPARTYMDLNIGLALWLAAGGDGWVDRGDGHCRYKYKSTAKILLVGSGADEQCAGYGRHRTKYRMGGWVSLQAEMRLDMQRIWKRNLGRDDRCFSDHGKEARFPFLDEDVIRTLLEIPLWEIANLDEPVGRGDKKILREVAKLLGLETAAVMPKRAIQFGSRIARESNRKNFGSNRAANQASAGSVEIQASSL